MLRKNLLAITALVLCVSIATAGQKINRPGDRTPLWNKKFGQPARAVHGFPVQVIRPKFANPGQNEVPSDERPATFNNLSKYANARFILWYGFTYAHTSSCYSSSNYHSCFSSGGKNAVGFIGAGMKVKKIKVPVWGGEFQACIDSATASGLPGNHLVCASATPSGTLTTVAIKPTLLNAGTKYFLEIAGPPDANGEGAWGLEDTDFSGAAVDYFHRTSHGSYGYGTSNNTYSDSSTWHASTYLPATGAAIIR